MLLSGNMDWAPWATHVAQGDSDQSITSTTAADISACEHTIIPRNPMRITVLATFDVERVDVNVGSPMFIGNITIDPAATSKVKTKANVTIAKGARVTCVASGTYDLEAGVEYTVKSTGAIDSGATFEYTVYSDGTGISLQGINRLRLDPF